ncbi:moxd2 [Symbiodinium sp. CCMP2592]|nr:moxd2 [Symbiodinium sp. CCMP2592]
MGWMRCGSCLALLAIAGASNIGASNISCLDSFRSVSPLPVQAKHCLLHELDALVESPQRFYFEKIGVVVGYEILSKLGEIEFTFAVPSTGWFGFGISEVGSMIGADMVILEDGPNGFKVTDAYSHGFERPVADKLQNWRAQSITHLSLGETCLGPTAVTKAVLRRMMKTCDGEDEDLGPQWMQNYFVAAYGDGRMNYHGQVRETTSHYMFLPEPILHEEALEAVEVDVMGPRIKVPQGQTNHCYTKVEIPCDLKVHAWAVLNINNLHHMHLGPLEPELDFAEQYQCSSYSPGQVSLSWGLGDAKKVLPNSLFIELKAGTYVLEAHFENPRKDAFDIQTGFRLWAASSDVSADKAVGITSINGVWRDVLPANHIVQKSFVLTQSCTDTLPAHGVTVIGALAHMHYAGKSMKAYRTRRGRTEMLFEQRGFDFNRQAVIYKSFKLMPGDVISWTCTWDLRNLGDKVWGLSSEDEMCQIFLAANPPLPFARGVVGIPSQGDEYGVCGTRACFDLEECSTLAPHSKEFHKIELQPLTTEEGPQRELCELLVEAEATPPVNNWILPHSMIVHLGLIAVAYKLVSLLYSRGLEGHLNVLKRSLNCVLALLGMIVGTLIACHPEWFLSEAEKVYSVNEAIGSSFWSLSACADLVGSAYVFELIVRGSNECLRWDLAVHHSATIAIIGMLRNAFAYEYAPQFYASIAACLLLHVVTDVPVLLIFALRGVPGHKTCFKRSLFAAAWIKLAMHAAINVCSFYLFVSSAETFRLANVSFASWLKTGYNKDRPLATDAMRRFDWAAVLQVGIPALVCILFFTQMWTTWVLVHVSRRTVAESAEKHEDAKSEGTASLSL